MILNWNLDILGIRLRNCWFCLNCLFGSLSLTLTWQGKGRALPPYFQIEAQVPHLLSSTRKVHGSLWLLGKSNTKPLLITRWMWGFARMPCDCSALGLHWHHGEEARWVLFYHRLVMKGLTLPGPPITQPRGEKEVYFIAFRRQCVSKPPKRETLINVQWGLGATW